MRSMLAWPAFAVAAALAAVGLALHSSGPRSRFPAASEAAPDAADASSGESDAPQVDRAVFAQDFDVSWAAFLEGPPEPTAAAHEEPLVAELALDASPLAGDLRAATLPRSVPEPSTIALVSLGMLALRDRRRTRQGAFSFARA